MLTVAKVFPDRATAVSAIGELDALALPGLEVSLAEAAAGPAADGGGPRSGSAKATSIGAAVGTGAGILAGMGLLAVPGFGPLLAAGWFATVLATAGMGAATGGVIGALTSLGIDENEAARQVEGLHRGGTLVIVRARDAAQASSAEALLNRHIPPSQPSGGDVSSLHRS